MHDTVFDVPAAPNAAPVHQARALPLTFTGSGAEYFRIWIVNLLLTIVTLGIYSAWAKVRRLQYFDRNTALDGAAFDFHGKPLAILKGRIVALVLLAGYQYAFGLSLSVGLVIFGALLLVLPYLLRGALRFRLYNTSWRGLRFGFTGSVAGAYAAFVPPMLLFMAPALLGAFVTKNGPQAVKPWFALLALVYLAWPLMHAAVKRYQHAHIRFGDAGSIYTVKAWRFFLPYLAALGMMIVLGIVTVVVMVPLAKAMPRNAVGMAVSFLPLLLAYVAFLSLFPFLQARLGNLVWSHTGFPGLQMRSDLTYGGLFKLHALNTLATLCTLGLFRPFAAVRTQRYLLAHLHITSHADIDALVDTSGRDAVNAVGDGAADFLGIDFAL